jgi:hypothetical protein
MSRENGQYVICDRCGVSIFRKCTGDGEMDGGFTRWNKFETADGWSVDRGDLCPSCTQKLKDIHNEFWSKAINEEKRFDK